MKNVINFLFMIIVVLFFSCESDFIDTPKEKSEKIETKSLSAEIPNPISQLTGIPVNIIMPAGSINNSEYYFSARPDKSNTILHPVDDKSGRQQWYIEQAPSGYYLRVKGGVYGGRVILNAIRNNLQDLGLSIEPANVIKTPWQIEQVGNTDKYKISYLLTVNNPNWYKTYIRAWQYGSTHLRFDQTNNSLGDWEIRPVEEFELKNISYALEESDVVTKIPSFFEDINLSNQSPIQQSMTATFTSKALESSSFSRTEGISINTSLELTVGAPLIAEGKLITSVASNKSWTFGKSESREDTRSYSFNLAVPPHSIYKARIVVALYNANVTYIATYIQPTSKKEIKLKGKWNGIVAGEINYEIYNLTGELVKTISGR